MSDVETLKEMGFDAEKAAMAVEKGGNLQGAIDWLDRNQEKTVEELKAADDEGDETGMPSIQPGDAARSLVCKDCDKKFRTQAQAEFHATKTEHMNFEESTDEIAPLTEEEKQAKLEELRRKLAEKRAGQSQQDLMDKKRNEEINRKKTRDTQDLKEELAKKEQIKEAARKRQEKLDDLEAKRKIKAKIEADKEARRLKAEREKAQRAGQSSLITIERQGSSAASAGGGGGGAAGGAAPQPKTAASYSEARLRLQTPTGTVQKTFPVETTLFEVAQALQQENGTCVSTFTSNFPKKIFDRTDFGQTLREAGMVPSAALIVR